MNKGDEIDGSRAPLLDHLIELRKRLLYSVLALLAAFALAFNFADDIFGFLAQPLMRAYAALGQGSSGQLIYTKLYEAFFVEIKVALFAAFLFAFPLIANQIWLFVAPGLYRQEKRALLPFLIATPLLFLAGASLAYFVVMPTVFEFLLKFQNTDSGVDQVALPAMGDYLAFVMNLIFAFGFCFLLPVLLLLLVRVGIINVEQLKAFRRYAIVIAFVIAAVITPPDIISQLLLAVPMILLYEASILCIRITDRRKQSRALVESGEKAPSRF